MAGAALLLTTACGPLATAIDEGTEPKKHPVTMAFGGDVHFEGMLRAKLDADPDAVFGSVANILRGSDIAMVNLETAITTGGVQAPKQFAFRAPPTAFRALKSAGVDVVSMANNHGMDYGEPGLRDSLAAARSANFPVVGIGENAAAAYRPWTVTVKNTKVAVIGATQVLDDNLITAWTATDAQAGLASAKDAPRLVQAVRAAREQADIVVVHLHWGQELNSCATPVQRTLAGQLVDAGADAVVGGHAHVLQAGGYLRGKYVHYGLGNFLFYNSSGRTAQSGVLELTFDPARRDRPVTRSEWRPATIVNGVAQPLRDAPADQARRQWEGLRSCADVRPTPDGAPATSG
ncbi:CapA family protein [Actinomadura craniellae]|uniref:CapA family protein n=2 Tax=Actinomadura craniellae TaxID=2231787 RepID=A0A365H7M2_9ACTN|nr:CapA family protein [Actinomadura craniellae]